LGGGEEEEFGSSALEYARRAHDARRDARRADHARREDDT